MPPRSREGSELLLRPLVPIPARANEPQDFDFVAAHTIGDDRSPSVRRGPQSRHKVVARRAAFGKLGEPGDVGLDAAGTSKRRVRVGALGDPVIKGEKVGARRGPSDDGVALHALSDSAPRAA